MLFPSSSSEIAQLEPSLRSDKISTRMRAAKSAGASINKETLDICKILLEDKSDEVKLSAAIALAGNKSAEAQKILLDYLSEDTSKLNALAAIIKKSSSIMGLASENDIALDRLKLYLDNPTLIEAYRTQLSTDSQNLFLSERINLLRSSPELRAMLSFMKSSRRLRQIFSNALSLSRGIDQPLLLDTDRQPLSAAPRWEKIRFFAPLFRAMFQNDTLR
jgi:hypothetical protein